MEKDEHRNRRKQSLKFRPTLSTATSSTTMVYDEFLKASKDSKAKMLQDQEKINSVGESASSGSLSSDPDKKGRRLSPPYQTVVNKHGDEVEYALPYNERDSLPPLPTTAPPDHAKISNAMFDQIINENFQFLNSNFFNLESESLINRRVGEVIEPVDVSFTDVRRKNVQVTDLDKSSNVGLGTPAQSGDIIRELDTLARWTSNLRNCERNVDVKSPIGEYQAIHKNIKVFNAGDIKFKSSILRNTFSTPLDFSNGNFHTTPVTLRTTLPNLFSMSTFADVASKREFEILT